MKRERAIHATADVLIRVATHATIHGSVPDGIAAVAAGADRLSNCLDRRVDLPFMSEFVHARLSHPIGWRVRTAEGKRRVGGETLNGFDPNIRDRRRRAVVVQDCFADDTSRTTLGPSD